MWIGNIHGYNQRYKEAAAQFREVAEAMPTGPEKSIALLSLGFMLEYDQARWNDAARYYKSARDAPDNSWYILLLQRLGADHEMGVRGPLRTHEAADRGLTAVRRAAKK